MRKRIIVIVLIIVILFILMPIPNYLKDGGSVEYKSLLYSVTKYHKLDFSTNEYIDGLSIKIFGLEIFNNFKDTTLEYSELGDDFSIEIIENLVCNNENIEYYKNSSVSIYIVCLDEVVLREDNKITPLKDFFDVNSYNLDNAILKIVSKLELVSSYDDGASVYKNDKITMLKCNSLNENKDVYIGSNYFDAEDYVQKGYCE